MIIVTGTKRSGTSMWLQILAAAGFPVFGDRFPRHWGEHFAALNPDGFYESELIAGIYFRTNPHPVTGVFLFPEQTQSHAVKVFIPGLVRTDLAFIDRVIATIRPWRDFARSRARLRESVQATTGEDLHGVPLLPAPLEWWTENFSLIRDLATRRYAVHTLSYDSLLADPEANIRAVLSWIGAGDPDRACAVVRRDRPPPTDSDRSEVDDADLEPRQIAIFDELYDRIHRGRPLDNPLIERLNLLDRELRPRLLSHNAAVKAAALAALATAERPD